MRHATDADHVIAVSTIVSRQRSLRGAAWIGALWGFGHTLTVCAVGVAILVFTVVIPPRLGLAMEFAVGVMLVVLGVLSLSGFRRWIRDNVTPGEVHYHAHTHAHGDHVHHHMHGHYPGDHGAEAHGARPDQAAQAWTDRRFGNLGVYQAIRPVVVGSVHGLAGSAAVALIALTAIGDAFWGVIYLLLFGLGTVIGMMIITLAIALPIVVSAKRFPRFNAYLRVGSGIVSVSLGVFLIYYIGFVGGLFAGNPSWLPS